MADITSNLKWALDFNGSTTNTGSAGGSATLTGSPSYGTGHITAQCLVLNGTSQWAEISGAAIAGDQIGTVAMWIKSEDNGGEDKAPVFGVGESDDDGTLCLWWFGTTSEFDASRRIGVINREATGDWNYGNSTTVPHGTWAHIGVTSDGSDWALYVNGVAVTMTSTGGAANTGDWWGDLTQTPLVYNIGRFPRGSTSFRLYKGSIERFRLYDRCLTSDDMAALHADTGGGGGTATTRLIGGQLFNSPLFGGRLVI